jgi:two-component system, cell cycle sensor histidine kinase and response regulator CckA
MNDKQKTGQHLFGETALFETERKYQKLLDSIQESYYETDLPGNYVFFNNAFQNMSGYSREELNGMNYRQYVAPEDVKKVFKIYNRIFRTGIPVEKFIYESIKKDGEKKTREASASLIYDSDGRIVGFRGIDRDITDRKQAEDRLKESEEKYRLVVENAIEAIYVAQDGRFKFYNRATKEIFDRTDEALLSSPFMEFIHPEDLELVVNRHMDRLKGKTPPPIYASRIVTADGTVKWIERHVTMIIWQGRPATLNFVADITERKRFEAELRYERERFENFAERAPFAMMQIEKDGTIGYINPKFRELFGYERQEIPDVRNWLRKAYPDKMNRREVIALFNSDAQLFKSGEKRHRTFTTTCKNGSEKIINFVTAELNNDQYLITCEDITESKKLEARILQAQKMESIGTLAGGIAHDFNNLLMGIQGYASLMLLTIDESHPHYEKLKAIEAQVGSGADLTRQLLGFARGGRYEVKPTDINELISRTSSLFGRTKKEIHIHNKFPKYIWSADVDRGQIEQSLLNLLVNAWQAMPGGGHIYLETENVVLDEAYSEDHGMRPGTFVKISVTDTGMGMDEKTRQRIFDPFFTTKGMGRGSGLGLASTYGIIKGHGGIINVYSEKGLGTTFTIYLPASEKDPAREPLLSHVLQKGQETILIVDDEELIIAVIKSMLEGLGYHVLTACTGSEAIDTYRAHQDKIDLIILDMIMPGMGGGEIFDRMKTINTDVKVILSSGYSMNSQTQSIMDRGVKAFIQKPFRIHDFSIKIRAVLNNEHSDQKYDNGNELPPCPEALKTLR